MILQQQLNKLFIDNPEHDFSRHEIYLLFSMVSNSTIDKMITNARQRKLIFSPERTKWRLVK